MMQPVHIKNQDDIKKALDALEIVLQNELKFNRHIEFKSEDDEQEVSVEEAEYPRLTFITRTLTFTTTGSY